MIATAFECFEIRAAKFHEKYGVLAPGKDSREEKPDNVMELWRDFGRFEPCLCGKEIPDNWHENYKTSSPEDKLK